MINFKSILSSLLATKKELTIRNSWMNKINQKMTRFENLKGKIRKERVSKLKNQILMISQKLITPEGKL